MAAYASLFLSTLPHTSLDAGTWVWSWVISESIFRPTRWDLRPSAVTLLSQCSMYILGNKVRSRALLFLYRLFFQLVYHAFYRNLVSLLRLYQDRYPDSQVCTSPFTLAVRYRPASVLSACRGGLSPTNDKTVASGPASGRRQSSALRGTRRGHCKQFLCPWLGAEHHDGRLPRLAQHLAFWSKQTYVTLDPRQLQSR